MASQEDRFLVWLPEDESGGRRDKGVSYSKFMEHD